MNKPNPYTQHRANYILTNRFYVEIGSEIKASFSECSGFGVNMKKETLLEGGLNDQQHILVGHAEFDDVTLKRGMTNDLTFWNWLSETLSSYPKTRYNLNILMFNQAGETQLQWSLLEAIPVSWKAPALQADSSSVAIEELTLAYEGIELILPNQPQKQSIQLQKTQNRRSSPSPTTNTQRQIPQNRQRNFNNSFSRLRR
ncbi:phage tail protein [Roseofilum capinflatum]|uniref:Phage tail protein n=1 Tax=Roseofilum capinflatum BLCC-M114 TaxID=3022440 RepID=A0ABT7B6N0_9CYAN|nr:phage tail protein [Roseofilum capinflatum]MDJ1174824.1 phage tail protein [Roseofilum capinflatum BLCC-M114]